MCSKVVITVKPIVRHIDEEAAEIALETQDRGGLGLRHTFSERHCQESNDFTLSRSLPHNISVDCRDSGTVRIYTIALLGRVVILNYCAMASIERWNVLEVSFDKAVMLSQNGVCSLVKMIV